jgi:hypothetical protein
MGVQVDQTGPDPAARSIDDSNPFARFEHRCDLGHHAVDDRHIGPCQPGRADDRSAPYHDRPDDRTATC